MQMPRGVPGGWSTASVKRRFAGWQNTGLQVGKTQVSGQRALAGGEEPTLVTSCVNEFCITIE